MSTTVHTLIDFGGSVAVKRAEETKSIKNNEANSSIWSEVGFLEIKNPKLKNSRFRAVGWGGGRKCNIILIYQIGKTSELYFLFPA